MLSRPSVTVSQSGQSVCEDSHVCCYYCCVSGSGLGVSERLASFGLTLFVCLLRCWFVCVVFSESKVARDVAVERSYVNSLRNWLVVNMTAMIQLSRLLAGDLRVVRQVESPFRPLMNVLKLRTVN